MVDEQIRPLTIDHQPFPERGIMSYLLGIDIGTSGTKTLLIDESGKTIASATDTYPLSTPKPLWAEQ